jgi:hypothetical protein
MISSRASASLWVSSRIAKEEKGRFLRDLWAMNISCETIYPGLDGSDVQWQSWATY